MLTIHLTGSTQTVTLQDVTGPFSYDLPGAITLPAFVQISNDGSLPIDSSFDLRFTVGRPNDETQPMPVGDRPSAGRSGLALSIVDHWLGGSGGWESPDGDNTLEYLYPTAWYQLSDVTQPGEATLTLDPGQSRLLQLGFRVVWGPNPEWAHSALEFPISVELVVDGHVVSSASTIATLPAGA